MTDTFVHEGIEVKKTGKVATKTLPSLGGKPPRLLKIYEITPVKDFDWVKWVAEEQLYKVSIEEDKK